MATTSNVKGGIPGLQKALRTLPKAASAELRDAAQEISGFVASDARGRASHLGGVARHVSGSVVARRDRVPAISLGKGDPAAFGAEFGGGRRATTQQFAPWRGSGRGAGYFLWPTIHDQNDRINERYSEALLQALRRI